MKKKIVESSDLCEYTRACLDLQFKIMARLLLLKFKLSAEKE